MPPDDAPLDDQEIQVGRAMFAAIRDADVSRVRQILNDHPEQKLNPRTGAGDSWMHYAATLGHIDVVAVFLDAGVPIDYYPANSTALCDAANAGHLEMARFLISRGANPDNDRTLIAAMNSEVNALEMIRLLVEEGGADVNKCWHWGDDDGPVFNALSFAGDPEIAEYLSGRGAVLPDDLPALAELSRREQLVAYMARNLGKVDDRSLATIVPTVRPEIRIHRCGPNGVRNSTILFTSGMSEVAMHAPSGESDFRFGELMIELPAKWPLTKEALADPRYLWPLQRLRRIANYPHEHQTWLGGQFSLLSDGDPPKPFAPDCPFTSVLLLSDYSDVGPVRVGSDIVHIYTLMPLYPEEQELEMSHGLDELFRRFDRFKIKREIDLKRKNVAIQS